MTQESEQLLALTGAALRAKAACSSIGCALGLCGVWPASQSWGIPYVSKRLPRSLPDALWRSRLSNMSSLTQPQSYALHHIYDLVGQDDLISPFFSQTNVFYHSLLSFHYIMLACIGLAIMLQALIDQYLRVSPRCGRLSEIDRCSLGTCLQALDAHVVAELDSSQSASLPPVMGQLMIMRLHYCESLSAHWPLFRSLCCLFNWNLPKT